MARSYEFAVLRLEPDAGRGEMVNVGVVVFDEGSADIRAGDVLTRARAIYPEMTVDALKEGIQSIRRLAAVDLSAGERHRLLSRVGPFTLGPLGTFSVAHGYSSYDEQVANLLTMFVRRPRRTQPRPKTHARLLTAVRDVFRKEKILAPIGDASAIDQHKIVPEWPIPGRPSLKADFALKNGVIRVCEVVELDLREDAPPPPALFSGVVTLDVAQREVGAQEAVFAYRAKGPANRVSEALSIAELHASKLVNWDSAMERNGFVQGWVAAAHG